MARTMTDEQERDIFAACDNDWTYTEQTYRKWCQSLKAELDAERAAHEATKAEHIRAMWRMGNRTGGSLVFGRIRVLEEELSALKERLKLAEAVCEWAEADTWTAGTPAWNALAAWRAGK